MFERLRRAFNTSTEVWNFAGYWAAVIVEYQRLSGFNLEKIAKASNATELLDEYCQEAMAKKVSVKDCAAAIFNKGFHNPVQEDALDGRNPKLAAVFHTFKDEVEGKRGHSAAQARHPDFRGVAESDFAKYHDQKGTVNEQGFNAIVSDSVGILLSTEKKLDASPDQHRAGISVGLIVVFRVLFGSGPGYANAIQANVYVTTLGILAKILTEYRAGYPGGSTTDFQEGASWAIADFLRRCQAAYGPPAADINKTQEAQRRLTEEFQKCGLDFMQLHSVIHRALLDEVILFGRVERTVEMFFETAALVEKKIASDDEKAQMLLDVWKARGEMYREAE